MLTIEEARVIGFERCVDEIGKDLMRQHIDTSTSSYGEYDGIVHCFVGMNDYPDSLCYNGELILSNVSKFPYEASCDVNMEDGTVSNVNVIKPNK